MTAPEPDLPADDECVDADGCSWPEHDFGAVECRRCGAEPEGGAS